MNVLLTITTNLQKLYMHTTARGRLKQPDIGRLKYSDSQPIYLKNKK